MLLATGWWPPDVVFDVQDLQTVLLLDEKRRKGKKR